MIDSTTDPRAHGPWWIARTATPTERAVWTSGVRISRLRLLLPTVAALAACASSGGSSDAWSRTYVAPRETVVEAVIDVLEVEGYLVDADRGKGRISAEPARGARNLVSLEVQVKVKGDRVLVDVQTRSGARFSSLPVKPAESPVLEFLHQLDLRMQGGPD